MPANEAEAAKAELEKAVKRSRKVSREMESKYGG
jgi:hypothetical protein